MRMLLRVVGGIVAAILLIVAAAYGLGALLPIEHVAAAETIIAAPPDAVAQRIGDPGGYDAWRDTTTRILSRAGNAIVYRESVMGTHVDYRITRAAGGRRFTSTILSDNLPFGGSWTISVTPAQRGTRVAVVERGVVRSPLWRFAGRYVFGQTMAIDGYLDELRASFAS